MRRALLLLVLLAAGAVTRAAAQTAAFGIGGQLTGELGGRVRVPVYADLRAAPGVKLGSYTVRVTWNPSVLTYLSVDEGTFGQPVVGTDSVYLGILKVGGLSASGVGDLVDLFAINFDIVGNQTSAVTLTVTEAAAAGTFTDLTGQTTALDGLYCPSAGRWGDLDGDGQANSRDALAILSAIVGLPVDPGTFTLSRGDVDADGVVNSRDALITLSYAVGLAVPGQRVLLYVPGAACGAGGTGTTVTILPDTVDVVVDQQVRLLLAGVVDGLPAGTTVEWRVADPAIAAVTADGILAGRAPGETRVSAALGPGIVASVPVIVSARRTVWHVDAGRATLAAIQLGTQRYPFATPQYAFPIVQEGDTIRVAPGVHDYLGPELCTGYFGGGGGTPPPAGGISPAPPPDQCSRYSEVTRGVVMIGDTLADGTRPVLRGNPDAYNAAQTSQGAWIEIRNLVLRNFGNAVVANGPTRFIRLLNTRLEISQSGTGLYVYSQGLDSLVARDVEIVGDSVSSDLVDVTYANVVVIDGLTGTGQYGMYFSYVDSLDIRNTDIRTRYRPLYSSGYNYSTQSSGRVYLADNHLEAESDDVAYLFDVLRVTSERNVYVGGDVTGYNILSVYGSDSPPIPGSRLAMSLDSVIRRMAPGGYSPLYVFDLDTVRLDSVIQVSPDSGFTNYGSNVYGNTVQILRSVFQNQGSSYPFYVGGRDITLSNSLFTGCRVACGTPYGVEFWYNTDSIARLQVDGNTFLGVYRAIAVSSNGAHRLIATNNTIDSVTQGMTLYGDSITLTGNVITRATQSGVAISTSTYTPRPWGLLQGNRIMMIGTGGQAVSWPAGDLTSQGNVYGGAYYGLYVTGSSTLATTLSLAADTIRADSALAGYAMYVTGLWNASVRRSRIEGGNYGLVFSPTSGSTLLFDSTVVTGTRSFGATLATSPTTTITGQWNNVSNNGGIGIQTTGSGAVTLTRGRFVGNKSWAVQAVSGTSVDATNSWWGNANGPGGGVADSVTGNVTWTPPASSDPLGVTVPAVPVFVQLTPDLWQTRLVGARAWTAVPSGSAAPTHGQIMAEAEARRAAVRAREQAHQAELEARRPRR